ncbi:MAG: CaiB/BaiF CoA transferase family protein [Vicinamibacteria bacterium]
MSSSNPDDFAPLRGVRILDLSRHAPGPFCTLVSAALGAEVVKVESPAGGDPLRSIDAEAFGRLNAGKKSIVLDLKDDRGRRALLRLARSADALVEGFRPGVMSRLGLDYEHVKKVSPRLIFLSLTGYGQSGPYRARAGHDVNYMAVAGALQGVSRPLPLQVADFAAGGLFAVSALLAALLRRAETGEGIHLDLSMQHGLLSLMLLGGGEAADRLSGRYPNYGVYRTRDGGELSVGALEPKFWTAFCAAIGRPDLESRMGDPEARAEVQAVLAERDLAYWTGRFRRVDACVEVVSTHDDARLHPQAVHRGAGSTAFSMPFLPASLALGRAPDLGEHTEEILGAVSDRG